MPTSSSCTLRLWTVPLSVWGVILMCLAESCDAVTSVSVTSLAGSSTQSPGFEDGLGTAAGFASPTGVALNSAGSFALVVSGRLRGSPSFYLGNRFFRSPWLQTYRIRPRSTVRR